MLVFLEILDKTPLNKSLTVRGLLYELHLITENVEETIRCKTICNFVSNSLTNE